MNKKALVTGGARRVGQGIVKHLADKGYDVTIHVNRSVEKGNQFVSDLKKTYPDQQFDIFSHNLVDWKELEAVITDRFTQKGIPDLIIHNASYYLQSDFQSAELDAVEEMMAIHVYSPMVIDKAFKRLGGTGNIITILDSAITGYTTSHGLYLLAKKTLAEYTKMAANEWAPDIRVNGIALGPVLPVEGKSVEQFDQVVKSSPMRKEVKQESIHASIDYIINNENLTGQILFCDSGQHLK